MRSGPSITAINPVGIPHSRRVAVETLLCQSRKIRGDDSRRPHAAMSETRLGRLPPIQTRCLCLSHHLRAVHRAVPRNTRCTTSPMAAQLRIRPTGGRNRLGGETDAQASLLGGMIHGAYRLC